MDAWTPLPGTLVPSEQAEIILHRFQQLYRNCSRDENRPANMPTWTIFPAGSRVDMTVLDLPAFCDKDTVYFYHENRRQLYTATPQQVKEYFTNRNPWETDWDLYVFDPNFNWCIAFTHELMNGSEVILVGNLE